MFRLTQFITTNLEYYNQVDSNSSGATPTQYQALPDGGALDQYGSQTKHPGVVEYTKSLRLQAATPTALSDLYMGLLKLRGQRGKLYRRMLGSDLIHWKWARLVEVNAKRDYEQAKFQVIQDVDLRFESAELFWHGTQMGWTFDDGHLFDEDDLVFDSGSAYDLFESPTSLSIEIAAIAGGLAPVRAIVIAVYAGDEAMSNVVIARTNGETLSYPGVIAAGDALVIDTGNMQVTNGGADAYNDLVLSPLADMAAWFTLEPGVNDITITYDGGNKGSVIVFSFSEAWY